MATEKPGQKVTKITAADYSAAQYRFCTLNSSGLAAVPAAGAKVYGVVQNKPASGEAATVMISGVSKVEAGGVIAAGADVATDNAGRAVAATTGNTVVGTAETPAGASGVYLSVKLDRGTVL